MMPPCLPLLLACAEEPDPRRPDPATEPPPTSEPPAVDRMDALVLEGRLTYGVDFGAPAEAAGSVDCVWSRAFVGQEAVGAAETVCGEAGVCDHVFFGWTVVPEAEEACFRTAVAGTLTQPEVWAVGPDGWFRFFSPGFGSIAPRPTEAPPAVGESVVTTPFSIPLGWYTFDLVASFVYDLDPAVVAADPTAEVSPYRCGWPEAGSRRTGPIQARKPLPDHVLFDQCDQPVHLGDLEGSYTLFLLASEECDTCALAASEIREVLEQHPDLTVVTLFLGTDDGYQAWLEAYHPRGPLLRDDGWGRILTWALANDTQETAWLLFDPEQTLVTTGGNGFTSWSVLDRFLP